MTGPFDSILGRRIDRVQETTLSFNPTQFDVAENDVRLCGTIVDIDPATGKATAIERIRVNEAEAKRLQTSVASTIS
jgi:calcineurin-like phosphoesterase